MQTLNSIHHPNNLVIQPRSTYSALCIHIAPTPCTQTLNPSQNTYLALQPTITPPPSLEPHSPRIHPPPNYRSRNLRHTIYPAAHCTPHARKLSHLIILSNYPHPCSPPPSQSSPLSHPPPTSKLHNPNAPFFFLHRRGYKRLHSKHHVASLHYQFTKLLPTPAAKRSLSHRRPDLPNPLHHPHPSIHT